MFMSHWPLGFVLLLAASPAVAGPPVTIGDVTFDPIGPGKNRANFSLHNSSATDVQRIGVRVVARSADGRNTWKGWIEYGLGSPSYEGGKYVGTKVALDANETRDGHYLFQIPEPFGPQAGITVEFFDLADPRQAERARRRQEYTPYVRKSFVVGRLPQRKTDWLAMPAAPPEQADAVRSSFAEAQLRLRLGLHARASELFSRDLRDVELATIPLFFHKRLYPAVPSWHTWDGKRFVQLAPREVRVNAQGLVLLAADADGRLRAVEMVLDKDEWKIDWVHAPLGGIVPTTAPATRPAR
jgi:hypothetical protein